MVTPGDPSCCLASSSATNRTRFRHRMVRLAPLPPSRSQKGPPETEDATVMLAAATTLQVHLAAIVTAHRLVGLSLDPGHSSIALLMDGIRRRKGTRPARQATPISAAMLARMVRAHHGCFERTGPLSTVLIASIHASCAEPNRRFSHHSGVPHGHFQVVGLKEISQLVSAIAVEDHNHIVWIIDHLQNAILEGVLLPPLVGFVARLPSCEVLNSVLYDCRCHGVFLPAALPAGQAW